MPSSLLKVFHVVINKSLQNVQNVTNKRFVFVSLYSLLPTQGCTLLPPVLQDQQTSLVTLGQLLTDRACSLISLRLRILT